MGSYGKDGDETPLEWCDGSGARGGRGCGSAARQVADGRLAGALMWVTVTFAYLIPALVTTVQILSGPRRNTSEVEVF